MIFDHFSDGYACCPTTHTQDLGILDSEIQPRNSEVPKYGPEIRDSEMHNSKYATCKYASCKYTSWKYTSWKLGLGTRKYRTQDMQLGNAHIRNAHLGKMRLKSTKGNEIIKTYN